jgi:hypothetical protein
MSQLGEMAGDRGQGWGYLDSGEPPIQLLTSASPCTHIHILPSHFPHTQIHTGSHKASCQGQAEGFSNS